MQLESLVDEGNFVSQIVQGFSVDNLSPQVPADLMVEIMDDSYNLSWQPVTDPDLQYYAVYISDIDGSFGSQPDYVTSIPELENISINENQEMVAVKAVDFSGNESDLSEPVDAPMMMTLTLQSGWSSLSGFVIPHNPALEEMFSELENELIFLNNPDGFWYPDQNQNTLIDWDSKSGYQIKLSQGALLTIAGYLENDQVLQLTQGWNLIPVLSRCPVSVAAIIDLLEGKMKVIKGAAGIEVAWPDNQISTLQLLMPGKAYFIYMDENAGLVFPDCE